MSQIDAFGMPATPIVGDEREFRSFTSFIFNYRTVVCFHPILVTFVRTVRSSLILSASSPFLAIILDTQISLSENSLNARTVMEAKLPKKVDRWDGEGGQLRSPIQSSQQCCDIIHVRRFSPDGRHVALGFGDGIIDLTGINQRGISRFQLDPWQQLSLPRKTRKMPVHSHGRTLVNLGINGPFPTYTGTLVSDNGSFVGRVQALV
ncbi:uncharacterized protein EI90DRAFT_3011873 [Cantharellus anzutake]|uniref:uncharacterized protein n=1 Tax=Cantharellus anzutake TaxID=1750568 RepID=UPI001907C53A|nr:uncharacterized protein EI90DRAFT_3011873 [Cantharellus anzutake]KAF8341232.1 hypothetical protein EI90DRAFT_3011873 [Cantharellus anzutake]